MVNRRWLSSSESLCKPHIHPLKSPYYVCLLPTFSSLPSTVPHPFAPNPPVRLLRNPNSSSLHFHTRERQTGKDIHLFLAFLLIIAATSLLFSFSRFSPSFKLFHYLHHTITKINHILTLQFSILHMDILFLY